jgi:hypothetical protein
VKPILSYSVSYVAKDGSLATPKIREALLYGYGK